MIDCPGSQADMPPLSTITTIHLPWSIVARACFKKVPSSTLFLPIYSCLISSHLFLPTSSIILAPFLSCSLTSRISSFLPNFLTYFLVYSYLLSLDLSQYLSSLLPLSCPQSLCLSFPTSLSSTHSSPSFPTPTIPSFSIQHYFIPPCFFISTLLPLPPLLVAYHRFLLSVTLWHLYIPPSLSFSVFINFPLSYLLCSRSFLPFLVCHPSSPLLWLVLHASLHYGPSSYHLSPCLHIFFSFHLPIAISLFIRTPSVLLLDPSHLSPTSTPPGRWDHLSPDLPVSLFPLPILLPISFFLCHTFPSSVADHISLQPVLLP